MSEEYLEYLMQNRDRLGLVLLRHCIIVAGRAYGWKQDQVLPQGRDPEAIVFEVIEKYLSGERKFVEGHSIESQLKNGVRSHLSTIYGLADNGALTLDAASEVATTETAPDSQATTLLDISALFNMLLEDPDLKKDEELQLLVMAIQDGAESAAEQSDASGIPVERIYELRKKLKLMGPRILTEFRKGEQ
ncbi:MAG: hypothetical protein QM627_08960 [Luteolibacter sp.]